MIVGLLISYLRIFLLQIPSMFFPPINMSSLSLWKEIAIHKWIHFLMYLQSEGVLNECIPSHVIKPKLEKNITLIFFFFRYLQYFGHSGKHPFYFLKMILQHKYDSIFCYNVIVELMWRNTNHHPQQDYLNFHITYNSNKQRHPSFLIVWILVIIFILHMILYQSITFSYYLDNSYLSHCTIDSFPQY